jgi:hypothetical protein
VRGGGPQDAAAQQEKPGNGTYEAESTRLRNPRLSGTDARMAGLVRLARCRREAKKRLSLKERIPSDHGGGSKFSREQISTGGHQKTYPKKLATRLVVD